MPSKTPVSPSPPFRAESVLPVESEKDPAGHDEQTDSWVAPAQRNTMLLSRMFYGEKNHIFSVFNNFKRY
jgi:hypothetical protein